MRYMITCDSTATRLTSHLNIVGTYHDFEFTQRIAQKHANETLNAPSALEWSLLGKLCGNHVWQSADAGAGTRYHIYEIRG